MSRGKERNDLEFVLTRDKHGVSRRRYKRVCIECGKLEWVGIQAITKGRLKCPGCAYKGTMTPDRRSRISNTLRAKYTDVSYKERVLAASNPNRGPSHWNWKGGVTSLNQKERSSEEAQAWRKKVFTRDLYHCRLCNKAGELHAHHIVSWSVAPELRFDVNNGMTLCEDCHTKIHVYFREVLNNNESKLEKSEREIATAEG